MSSLTVWACGREEATGPGPAVPSVEVTPASDTLVSLGETLQLTATYRDADATIVPSKKFTWFSSEDSIAPVSDVGLVSAVVNGSVTITAVTQGASGVAAIEVAQAVAQLTFAKQPTVALIGSPIQPAVQVAVEDARGNRVEAGVSAVTLALGEHPSGATLEGTTTQSPMEGVATFSDLSLDRAGVGYTLVASLASVPDVASARFDVITLVLVSVSAGDAHTCGVITTGTAHCWGSNEHGQLGTDAEIDHCVVSGDSVPCSPTPVRVAGGLNFATVSAGGRHTCGVTTTGTAYCWGLNSYGQLGDGTTTDRTTPVPVAGGIAFASVSTSYDNTCGLTTSGTAYCWGSGAWGEIGDGTRTIRATTPVAVSGGLAFVSLSAGFRHTCGATTSGTAYCWGSNWGVKLGDGTNLGRRTRPAPVLGGHTFTSVSPGRGHTCGVTTSGTAYCWGQNVYGQLGDGTTMLRPTPVAVAGGIAFASVSTSFDHTCGLTTSGTAYCWGNNASGRLGDSTTFNRWEPVPVSGDLTFASVSTGGVHSCGVTKTGTAYCWGYNRYSQLGDGTKTDRLTPVRAVGQP